MVRVLAQSWVPAVVLAVAIGAGLAALNGGRWEDKLATLLVTTPCIAAVGAPVWWLVVARRGPPTPGRGAWAGAACGAAVVLGIGMFLAVTWKGKLNDDYLLFALLLLVAFVLPTVVGIGAVVGAVLAFGIRWNGSCAAGELASTPAQVLDAEPLSWPTDLNKNEDPGTA